MRLFETNQNEGIDSPTPRDNEARMPHCRMYNPIYDGARDRKSSRKGEYLDIPIAIGLRKHEAYPRC